MRSIFIASAAMVMLAGPAFAQACEQMTVRNEAGQVVSSTMMCEGADGVWSDAFPATPQPELLPVQVDLPEEAAPEPAGPQIAVTEAVEPTAPSEEATLLPVEDAPDSSTDAAFTSDAEPVEAEPIHLVTLQSEPVTVEELETPLPEITETLPLTTPAVDKPAVNESQRQEAYAKLGLVCAAEKAVFCDGACTGKCAGKQGWCDGRTGKIHASLEDIERRYCRRK